MTTPTRKTGRRDLLAAAEHFISRRPALTDEPSSPWHRAALAGAFEIGAYRATDENFPRDEAPAWARYYATMHSKTGGVGEMIALRDAWVAGFDWLRETRAAERAARTWRLIYPPVVPGILTFLRKETDEDGTVFHARAVRREAFWAGVR